jgi:hypothetical protein
MLYHSSVFFVTCSERGVPPLQLLATSSSLLPAGVEEPALHTSWVWESLLWCTSAGQLRRTHPAIGERLGVGAGRREAGLVCGEGGLLRVGLDLRGTAATRLTPKQMKLPEPCAG